LEELVFVLSLDLSLSFTRLPLSLTLFLLEFTGTVKNPVTFCVAVLANRI
jgi:hypothetical protein